MYSKKGQLEDSTVKIIIILVGAIVIIGVMITVLPNVKGIVMHKMCTWSIIFKDKFILGTNLCYTDDSEVNEKDKEEVMKDIADKMVECWTRMDEGRANIDESWFVGGYKCFKCYRIKITGLKDTISYEDFYKFLTTNNIKGKEDSYYNFFKKYDEDNMVILVGKNEAKMISDTFIDPKQYEYYAIAFKGFAPVDVKRGVLSFAGVSYIGGKLGGGAILSKILPGNVKLYTVAVVAVWGAEELIRNYVSENSIIVAPYDKLGEKCSSTLR